MLTTRTIPLLFIFFLLLGGLAMGQESANRCHRHSVFADYNLAGPDYAVNYDYVFGRSPKVRYSFRAGISLLKDRYGLPLGFSVLTGRNDHHAEFGLTLTPFWEVKYSAYGGTNNDRTLFAFPAVGYRYQPCKGGLFARVAAGPLLEFNPPAYDVLDFSTSIDFSISFGLGFTF